MALGPVFTYILTNYRSLITVFILMPMSFFFEIYWQAKTFYILRFKSDPAKHGKRVAEVQDQVRKWAKDGNGKQMCTARPTWQSISSKVATYKQRMYPIRVELNDILEVNTEQRYIRVEPGVTMGQIYKFLIKQGWTLPVNPELDELSIGGLVNGYGIETSSHKHGLFLEVVKQITLVVPNGELLTCNERENEKVFRCVPWSYGTLGFLVSVDLAIIPAKKYVRLTYIPCYTLESFVQTYSHYQADPNPPEFLEGILFSRDVGVVTVGDQTDKVEGGKVNTTWWWKPYFFEQCKSTLAKPTEVRTDFIPLIDYYRRHNRSIFWDLYDICPATEWAWFRVAFGWMLPPRIPMIKYCQTDTLAKFYEENYALQDFLVPLPNMKEIIDICHRELRVYPLWLCPMRVQHTGKYQGFMVPKDPNVKPGEYQQYVDAATVGPPGLPIQLFDMRRAISTIEEYMRKNRGYQGNYGYTYQTREEYRGMYNHVHYDEVRKELGADRAFPEPYDKVGRRGFQTFSEGKIEKKMN